jgi:hypothetical protein
MTVTIGAALTGSGGGRPTGIGSEASLSKNSNLDLSHGTDTIYYNGIEIPGLLVSLLLSRKNM